MGRFSTPDILVGAFCVNGALGCRSGAATGVNEGTWLECQIRTQYWLWCVSLWLWWPMLELIHRLHLGGSSGAGANSCHCLSCSMGQTQWNLSGWSISNYIEARRGTTSMRDLLCRFCTVLYIAYVTTFFHFDLYTSMNKSFWILNLESRDYGCIGCIGECLLCDSLPTSPW